MRKSVAWNAAPHFKGDMYHRDMSRMRGQTWLPLAIESGCGIFAPSPTLLSAFLVSMLQRRLVLYPSAP